MALSSQIFREYDIRGIVGTTLDPEVAEAVGRVFGQVMRERAASAPSGAAGSAEGPSEGTASSPGRLRAAVGRDNRPSSPELADGLIRGLNAAGIDVLDVGTVPTPVLYWTERVLGADAGIQITGSHNPPEYNGIKMILGGRPFFGDDIRGLYERIRAGAAAPQGGPPGAPDVSAETWGRADAEMRASTTAAPSPPTPGRRTRQDVLDRYVGDVAGRFHLPRPVKVAVDCGNGTGAVVAVRLLEAAGAEVVPLYCTSDGTFPNHHPDPTVDEYLVELQETVRETGAEAGIAFDGDADRLGVVDETGSVVRADLVLLLFGLDLLARKGPGQKLVFDVKCSQAVPEVFGAAGGEPIMWKTGHSLMKEKMRETGAPLGGELSGHIFLGDDYYGFDDALYGACRIIDLLARSERPLSSMVADLPAYVSTPELRIEVGEERKFELVRDALEHFRATHEVIDVDGARILFGDGWGLLRASNTQPVVVARFEARSPERLAEIRGEVLGWLRQQGVEATVGGAV